MRRLGGREFKVNSISAAATSRPASILRGAPCPFKHAEVGLQALLQCLLQMSQVESALGTAESTAKAQNTGRSWHVQPALEYS